jgi:hypothetical protein
MPLREEAISVRDTRLAMIILIWEICSITIVAIEDAGLVGFEVTVFDEEFFSEKLARCGINRVADVEETGDQFFCFIGDHDWG